MQLFASLKNINGEINNTGNLVKIIEILQKFGDKDKAYAYDVAIMRLQQKLRAFISNNQQKATNEIARCASLNQCAP